MKLPKLKLTSMQVLRKTLWWGLGSLVVFTLVGFLVVPLVLKSVLISQLTAKLQREVTIQEIWFNPFLLSLEVNGLSIKDREGDQPFVSFKELSLNFQAASVFKEGPILRDVLLRAPHVTIIRNEDLTYNFSDLLQEFAAKPVADATPPPETKPFCYSLNNIRIQDGSIDFQDRPKHAQHAVQDINLGIPFLSNLSYDVNVYVQPAFAAKVNGTPIVLTGKTKPFSDPREAVLEVNVSNVDLPKYMEYVPIELRFKIPSARLDTKLTLSFTQYKDTPSALIVAGTIALSTLSVTDLQERPIVSFPLLDVPIASLDVFAKKVNLGSILLQSPEVHLWRDKTGILNVTTLVPDKKKEGTESHELQSERAEEARLDIEAAEVRLADGKVTFADEGTEPPFATTVQALTVVVRHFSTAPAKPSAIEVSFTTDGGEGLTHTGELTLEPLAVEGTVELQRLPVQRYAPYYGKNLLFDIEDAVLDLSTRYTYAQGEGGGQTTLSGLAATLSSIQLKKKGEKAEFLQVPVFSVKDADLDLAKRTLMIGELSSQKGVVVVTREKDGTLNLGTLVPQTPTTGEKTASSRTHVVQEAPSPPWLVTLKKIALDGYAVRMEDKAPAQPATLVADPVTFTTENFSTAKNSQAKASLRLTLNKTGTLSVDGPVNLNPLSANLTVDLKGLDLVSLQPYFADKIKIMVINGAASVNGNVTLNSTPGTDVKVAFTGRASLMKFATVEKANAEDFLRWRSLSLNGIKANTGPPFRLEINEVALADFYSRLIINPDATLNVQGIVASDPQASAKVEAKENAGNTTGTQKPGEAASIRIAKVTLQGGNINFSDRFIKPNYSAKLVQVGGRISGLSSEQNKQADVELRGRLDNAAPLEITGKINPFSKDLYVDLGVDFKDIDLSPMTPYAGKYAGYTIEKGKVSLNLKYLIADRKLSAQNKIFIDQFTFGDQIDSPDATKLPVRLAVSLLKDRNGAITLDLPVAGSLDDPQFSVWGVIVEVITNILSKAATAPLALLGAAFGGGGEELNSLEFDYGRANLDSAAAEKLKTLATALVDRPTLKLEIAGYVDLEKDPEGLKRYRFEQKLKAQKLNETGKKSDADVSLDEMKIEPEEYSKYLTLAYKKETFPKPRNIIGLAKDLPDAEMEQLILTHIEVSDDDLGELAKQRAKAVEDYLLQTGQLGSERIFLITPKALSPDKKDSAKDSRVDFALQ